MEKNINWPSGYLVWAFILCVAWFGYYNAWWPIAFPIVFTAIIGVAMLVVLVCFIIYAIVKLNR